MFLKSGLKSGLVIAILMIARNTFAIVGGVTITDPLPAYMTAADRATMFSHTVVVLNAQDMSSFSRCTGTLIAKNVVLTAAHCVPAKLENFFIVPNQYEYGVIDRLQVIDVKVHENYKSFDIPKLNQPNWDLALVKFAGDLPAGYVPTSWINNFSPNQDRFWLYVAGYGVSQQGLDDTGEIRFSRVTIENALFNAQQSFMVGNQSMGEGICNGDSGGPAYMKIQDEFYVLGVVSAIAGGCTGTSYFNQTLFYQNWIQENLNLLK